MISDRSIAGVAHSRELQLGACADSTPVGLLAVTTTTTPNVVVPIGPMIHGVWHTAMVFWPWVVLLAAAGVASLLFKVYDLRRLSRSGIADVDRMDGRTFETFLSIVFRREGYTVAVTRYRGDYGADLVIEKDGNRTAVQAKRWSKTVGIKAVQEAVASKAVYDCTRALVVANRGFTPQAVVLAKANDVTLWDREILIAKLPSSEAAQSPELPIAPTATPCVVCGTNVSPKVRAWCLARPDRFGGQVYCYRHQRGVRPPEPGLGSTG
jgi:restriction system protein